LLSLSLEFWLKSRERWGDGRAGGAGGAGGAGEVGEAGGAGGDVYY